MSEVEKVERWGFDWHGHGTHERMADGYWTPWDIANDLLTTLQARAERAEAQLAEANRKVRASAGNLYDYIASLEAQLAEARADERERCAEIARAWAGEALDKYDEGQFRDGAEWASTHIPTAIRESPEQ